MGKDSFIIYKAFWKPIERLSDESLGRLFRALFAYQMGAPCEVAEDISIAYEFFINQFSVDDAKYEKKVERIRNNASSANRNKSERIESNRTELNQIGGDNVNVNDNVNENENVYVNENVADLLSADIPEREKFLLILFFRNIKNPNKEVARFIACYEGKKLGSKVMLGKAYLWNPQEDGTRFSETFLSAWSGIVKSVPEHLRGQALADSISYDIKTGALKCPKGLKQWIVGEGLATSKRYLLSQLPSVKI